LLSEGGDAVRIFRFGPDVSHRVDKFGSSFLHQFLSVTKDGALAVSIMHFGDGDHVGYHRAVLPQLFAVVAGEGWVQDESRKDVAIAAGCAAFWEAGEWHAARAGTAMTAIVLEGEHLDPAAVMRSL
jgi:quercetin dioxygenase-like cupin family protein